jgi:uncharacterized protein YraI
MARRVFALLMMMLLLGACNLSGGGSPTQQPIPPTGNKPTVTITAPRNGDRFTVNQEVLVSATATDSVGITRVRLLVNGQISGTVTANGETTFSALFDFVPTTVGSYTLQVIAERSSTASDPAQVQITVEQPTAVITPTRTPQIVVPTSIVPTAFNPICRIRTPGPVNLRTGPGTNFNPPITTIPGGVEVPITGRLFDNTWWVVVYNSRSGWVSANVVQVLGNCFNIPIVQPPPPPITLPPPITWTFTPTVTRTPSPTMTPGFPDLVVTQLDVPATLNLTGGTVSTTATVTITNLGSGATGQFSNAVTTIPGVTQEIGVVGGLAAGQSVVLTFNLTFTAVGAYTVQVQADSGSQVTEASEVNNIGTRTISVVLPL